MRKLAWLLALLAGTAPARADRMSPPRPVSAVRAKVARVVEVTLAPGQQVVLVEWGGVAAGKATAPPQTTLVPLVPKQCEHVYSMVVGDPAAVRTQVGKALDGLIVQASKATWCAVTTGAEGIGPVRDPGSLSLVEPARQGDAALVAFGKLRDFFGQPSPDPLILFVTPLDGAIEKALAEMKSETALAFALDRRMFFFAARQFHWRTQPKGFATVERAMRAEAHGRIADSSLMDLFWRLSPVQARATIRKLYDSDVEQARRYLLTSPAWDDALDLTAELLAVEVKQNKPSALLLLALGNHGNERVTTTLREVREKLPARFDGKDLRERLAAIDRRVTLGVNDGLTLATYLWAHRDDWKTKRDLSPDAPFKDMRVSLVGETDNGCDVKLRTGAFEIRARVDCDAETLQRMYKVARKTIVTVTGVYQSSYVGAGSDPYVELRLDFAHIKMGR